MAALGTLVLKEIAGTAIVAGTPPTVWDPVAGKRVRLMGGSLFATAATAAILEYGAADTALGVRIGLGANTPAVPLNLPPDGILVGAVDDVLKLDVSANATIHGFLWGYEE